MAEASDGVAILSFSCGKDSIAAWLQMRKYFDRIIPVYKYFVPGLQFIERSLQYYEDFFGCHIYRLPHPAFFKKMNTGLFQPPYRMNVILDEMDIDQSEYNDLVISDIVREKEGLSDDVYTAVGVRMADGPMRRMQIKTSGCVIHTKKIFYPVYDWLKADIIREMDAVGIKLPVDYKMFGRSFDGLNYTYIKPLKEWFPDDYKRLLEWFPFAEMDLLRRGETDGAQKRKDIDR